MTGRRSIDSRNRPGPKPLRDEDLVLCCWPDCKAPVTPKLDRIPMCLDHALWLHQAVGEEIANRLDYSARADKAGQRQRALTARLAGGPNPEAPANERRGLIYYMRFGNRVKIGWTANLQARTISLSPDEVMATEDGTQVDEHARHMQFGGAWARDDPRFPREMFHLTPELRRHIARLRAA